MVRTAPAAGRSEPFGCNAGARHRAWMGRVRTSVQEHLVCWSINYTFDTLKENTIRFTLHSMIVTSQPHSAEQGIECQRVEWKNVKTRSIAICGKVNPLAL